MADWWAAGAGLMLPGIKAKVVPGVDDCAVEVVTGTLYLSLLSAIVFAFVGLCFLIASLVEGNGLDFGFSFILVLMIPSGIAYQNHWSRMRLLNTFANQFSLTQP